jgi:hypothetical protein
MCTFLNVKKGVARTSLRLANLNFLCGQNCRRKAFLVSWFQMVFGGPEPQSRYYYLINNLYLHMSRPSHSVEINLLVIRSFNIFGTLLSASLGSTF